MPNYSSKRTARKRQPTKRPMTASQVARIARNVTRSMKPAKEIRFVPSASLTMATVAASYNAIDITNIANGTAVDERTGREIVLTGFKYDIAFDNNRGAERWVRFFVVQEHNPQDPADYSTFTDTYQTSGFGNHGSDKSLSDITYPLNRDVFKIYLDKKLKMSPLNINGANKRISGYCALNQKILYSDAGDTINVPSNCGRIYVIVHIAESTASTSADTTVVNGMYRVFFRDN